MWTNVERTHIVEKLFFFLMTKVRVLTSSSSFKVALGTADVSPAFLFVAAIV